MIREDIQHFPPPHEHGQLLGHDGRLTEAEVEYLQSLGYVVQHYKAFSGAKMVQAFFEGVAKGLIEFDPVTNRAMDTIRKQFTKTETNESNLKAEGSAKEDIIQLLSNIDIGTDSPYNGVSPKKRGRPPGSKNG